MPTVVCNHSYSVLIETLSIYLLHSFTEFLSVCLNIDLSGSCNVCSSVYQTSVSIADTASMYTSRTEFSRHTEPRICSSCHDQFPFPVWDVPINMTVTRRVY